MSVSVSTRAAASNASTPKSIGPGGARVVCVVRREGLGPVFQSQVLSRMARVAQAGFNVDIGVFAPLGQFVRPALRRRWADVVAKAPPVLAGRIRRLPSLPSRVDWPSAETRILRWWLAARGGRSERPMIVQCRNATVTSMALAIRARMPSLRVVFDCRGVQDHEFLYSRGATLADATGSLRDRALRLAEEQRLAAREADAVLCVSEALVDYVVSDCSVRREKCLVVPCCVDVEGFARATPWRDEMRKRLGIEDRFVVAYCGSLARYQLPGESLRLFNRLHRIDPRAHFLAVTTQPRAMESAISAAGLPAAQYTVLSVPHEQVPRYLAAADVGLLLRERSPVNEVASPVKFGEYLASGTPVILSDGIGDFSELARREQAGLVLGAGVTDESTNAELAQFLDAYRDDPPRWRERCARVARAHLSDDAYMQRLVAAYLRLESADPLPQDESPAATRCAAEGERPDPAQPSVSPDDVLMNHRC